MDASRKGADVLRDEHNALMADTLKPLTGMNPEQQRVYKHRLKLSPRDKACYLFSPTRTHYIVRRVQKHLPCQRGLQ